MTEEHSVSFEEFLRAILQVLEAAGVDYLIGGGGGGLAVGGAAVDTGH